MGKLAGQTALVTGASRGVGRAIAIALAADGMRVLGTSRNPVAVEWPAGVEGVQMDTSSAESVAVAWDKAGLDSISLDVVVNNAGAGVFGGFGDVSFESWEGQIGLLLLGPMKVAQLALRGWSVGNPGVLVNVGSLACEFPIPYMAGYNAAKAGLAAFSESLELECDPEVARVLELRLGDISTGFNEAMRGQPCGESQEAAWQAMCKHVEEGPAPERVARKLVGCLKHNRSGVVKVGGFFQVRIASLFGRLVSHSVKTLVNRSYYNLSKH